eukprot:s885_g15.t1
MTISIILLTIRVVEAKTPHGDDRFCYLRGRYEPTSRLRRAPCTEKTAVCQLSYRYSSQEVRLNNNLVGSSLRMRLTAVAQETHGSDFTLRV